MLVLVMLAVGVASRRRAATEAGRKAERQASARLEALVRHGSDVITVVGTSGIVVYQSPSTLAITGCRASDIEGKRFADWVHPDDQHLLVDLLSLDAGDREELRLRRGDGEWLTCEVLATSLADHPEIGGTVLNIRDMTERKQAEGALRDSEEKFRLLFQKNPHPMWVFDLETLFFMEVNQAAVERYGYSRDEFLSMRITDLRPEEDVAALRAFVASPKPALNNAGVWRHCTRRGETLDVDVTSYALEFGGKAARLVTAQDVTARIAAERALVHQAMHDRLTGLPNRLLLLDRLEQGLERAARSETEVAVIVLDLDRFKLINDGKGHAVGDQLLVEVANRLSGAVSPGDTLARLGGDEFVVVVEGITDEPQTMVVCERLAWCLDAPFVIDGCELKVSASQGIALAKPGEAAAEVLSRADAAMYLAKDRGRGRAEFADESIRAEAAGRLELESALRRAHDRGEFVIHYQPVIALATGRIVGAEALARWQHPDDGLVGPARFIAAAEASGLIVPIGGAILRQALKDAATWPIEDTAAEPLSVAVNLSALQLLVPDVAAMVASAISDSGLDAARVHLEITESVLMRDIDRSAGVLRALKQLGVHIDIDDFGTGYSSLNYLQRLPIDTIKIDKSFVDRLDGPDQDHSIVHAVISMAHALRMGVVAEGVESEHQRIVLSELGCELAQGFLFARPVPLTVFEDLLRSGPFPEVGGAPSEAPVPLAVV
jgi:diguanylate cyclase (GGDEF)-like protein/PAS domain S-box-containing protein